MLQSLFRRLTNRPAISDDEASDAGDVVIPIASKIDDDVGEDEEPAAVTGDLSDEEQEKPAGKADDGGEDEDVDMDEDEYVYLLQRRATPVS